MSPRVVLVGLPGAGKSTSGRRLAKILALPFADSDDLVEAAAGRAVTEIFAEDGENSFRAAEAAAIAAALVDFDGVLALGGGALICTSTRAALVSCDVPVVVLRAQLATLGSRVGDARTRPLLAADPNARLAELAAERAPLYEEVATFVVDTDRRTPGQVAATVAARLHERRVRT
ncbi:shikimate kinase [uncultured Jatrophihabitans sp.]|uniref:shikimate kinase n=1 Tax=uncultured Jatrophihabitans sp. TaxID=1610747 RepID=UPI0035CC962F